MISRNLAQVREKIAKAAERAGRNPKDITLVSVTKQATVDQVREAVSSGITDIGENRVNDGLLKYEKLGAVSQGLRWHMIGHLQTNKVRKALDIFDTIHSLDSLHLAEEIDNRAKAISKRVDCFIEVSVSGEASKYGIEPKDAEQFIVKVSSLSNIHIIGLMTMAPFVDDAEITRPYFAKLRQLRDNLRSQNIPNTAIRELSMGMTQDFEVAIEEGATVVRIGSAIFK
ncbi:MAG: YggS family pyridoxal phosphate-dependent enzyme [Candidatus Omnitrophica bacterium]|nr:YggS family pyridoxal phosphate-dependent enzyme [Candidatus Omnitrophota bacterium]